MPPYDSSILSSEEADRMRAENIAWHPPTNPMKSRAPNDVILLVARCWSMDPVDRPSLPVIIKTLSRVLQDVVDRIAADDKK